MDALTIILVVALVVGLVGRSLRSADAARPVAEDRAAAERRAKVKRYYGV